MPTTTTTTAPAWPPHGASEPFYYIGERHYREDRVLALNDVPTGWSAADVNAYWDGVADAHADACPDTVALMALQHADAF